MLFDGIPEARRQRFDSYALEQPLRSTASPSPSPSLVRTGSGVPASPSSQAGAKTAGGASLSSGNSVVQDEDETSSTGLSLNNNSNGKKSSDKVVYRSNQHDADLRSNLAAVWTQKQGLDLVVFVKCTGRREDIMREFKGRPIACFADGLANMRMHSLVVAAMSPLLRHALRGLRSMKRVASRTSSASKMAAAAAAAASASGSVSSAAALPDGAEVVADSVMQQSGLTHTFEGVSCLSLDPAHVEGTAFMRAIAFIYTGSLSLSDASVSETLRACHFLGLQGGVDLCVEYLLQKLQPCNALRICALGNLFDCGRLEELADEYLSDHFMEVTQQSEWLELDSDAVDRLLRRDNLKCNSEASVVRALVRWATHKPVETIRPVSSDGDSKQQDAVAEMEISAGAGEDDASLSSSASAEAAAAMSRKRAREPAARDTKRAKASHPSRSEGDNLDAEDSDDDDDDEEEEEEEEDRKAAFAKILENGSIRFAHLSDEEIEVLIQELQDTPDLLTIWEQTIGWEKVRRERRAERIKRVQVPDDEDDDAVDASIKTNRNSETPATIAAASRSTTVSETANPKDAKDENGGDDDDDDDGDTAGEERDDDDDDDDDYAIPKLRRYAMARGSQVKDDKCEFMLEGHGGYVYAVTESPAGNLVSGSRDHTIRVWPQPAAEHTPGTERVLEGHQERVFGLLKLSNGKVASCSFDQTIRIWDPESWECEKVVEGHTGWVVAIAEVAGRLVSGSADNTIKVWNVDTWECEHTLTGHADHVYGVCRVSVQRGGRTHDLLATGSQDSTVKIWNPRRNWRLVKTLHGHRGSIRSIKQVGKFLATASADRTIRLWHLREQVFGKPAGKLIGHSDVVESLVSVPGPDPAGRPFVVSASRDNCIKVWDTSTKLCVKTLVGHRSWVKSLHVLSSGKLASASADKTVRIWDLSE